MDKTLREALDDWEKSVDRLIEETKKVGATASKELGKHVEKVQTEGEKLRTSIGKGEADEKIRVELEKRYHTAKDKLNRAWKELHT